MKAAYPLLLCLGLAAPAAAQLPDDVPLGVEALTGLRSAYNFRGQEVSDALLDFQLQTEVSLSDELFLNLGGLYAAEGSGDFREASAFASLQREMGNLTLSGLLTYRGFDSPLLDSGLELGAHLTYSHSEDLSLDGSLVYDTGADSFYAELGADYSQVLSDSAYWSARAWVGAADDYYDLSGLVSVGIRLSLTYNVNSQVSLTPFLTAEGSGDPDGDTTLSAGLWFAVSF